MQVLDLINQASANPQMNEDEQKLIVETGTSIVEEILKSRHKPVVKVKTPNRNDPCPCGSGKKYKKCCMDIDQSIINKL